MKKQYIIPIFIPYEDDYIFGNQKEKIKKITKERTTALIEERLKNIEKNSKIEIAFLGGNFLGLKEEKQDELLSLAKIYVDAHKVDCIRISANPNYINKKILKKLKKYKVKTIELEVKSVNDYILKKAEAGYIFKDIKKASKAIRFHRFNLGYRIMIGLPESTHLDEVNATKKLIKLKPKMVRLYPVLIIKNTKLEKEYNEENYKALTIVQAIETCKEIVKLYAKKNIEVIRIGLQPSDMFFNPEEFQKKFIEGPYKVNFRQLVESGMWYDVIVEKIKQLNTKVKEVVVTVNPIDVNNVIGQNNENIEKLKEIYDVELKVKGNENIKQGKSKIEITKLYEDFAEDKEI